MPPMPPMPPMSPMPPIPPPYSRQSSSTEPRETAGSAAPGCFAGFHTPLDRRNERRFNLWIFAATVAYLGATAALRREESLPRVLPWLLVGLAVLLAVMATRSYLRFLREADELLRRIQMEAMVLGFGAGAVYSLLYPLLEGLGAPALGGHATALVMMLSWGAGTWRGSRRYAGGGAT